MIPIKKRQSVIIVADNRDCPQLPVVGLVLYKKNNGKSMKMLADLGIS